MTARTDQATVAGGMTIAGRTFGSRLILGSGRFDSPETLADRVGNNGAAFGGRDVSGDELIRMIGPFGL